MAPSLGNIFTGQRKKIFGEKVNNDSFKEGKKNGRRELITYDEWGLVYEGGLNLPILFSADMKKKYETKEIERFIRLLNTL